VEFIDAAEDIHDARIAEGVEDLVAPAIGDDEADAAEHGEVIGYRRHIETDERSEVGDASFGAIEGIDDQEAVGIAEGFEDLGGRLEVGGRFRSLRGACLHAWQLSQITKYGKWEW